MLPFYYIIKYDYNQFVPLNIKYIYHHSASLYYSLLYRKTGYLIAIARLNLFFCFLCKKVNFATIWLLVWVEYNQIIFKPHRHFFVVHFKKYINISLFFIIIKMLDLNMKIVIFRFWMTCMHFFVIFMYFLDVFISLVIIIKSEWLYFIVIDFYDWLNDYIKLSRDRLYVKSCKNNYSVLLNRKIIRMNRKIINFNLLTKVKKY